jgi:purine-nucleoside phosphorylase
MRIRDHLNLQRCTPLARHERGSGPVWDEALGRALERGARAAGVALESGVYAGLSGPAYETPAEIRMLRTFGADAVGMSTVAEALAARAAGLRVAGVSCITNFAAGLADAPLAHADVLEVGRRSAREFCNLLERAVPELAAA